MLALFWAGSKCASKEEAQGSADGGEGRAKLVGDSGDELVLHAVKGTTFGGVGEGYDDADGFVPAVVSLGFDLRTSYVIDGEAGSVFTPEDFVGDADSVKVGEALADGRVFGCEGGAVVAGVMNEIVQVAAEHLFFFVTEHLRGSDVGDGDVAIEVDGEDAVADGLEDGVGLTGEGAETAFGAYLFADVDTEAQDIGGATGDVDEFVAVSDNADIAVGV